MRVNIKKILLVEDNANDAELTLTALAEKHLANEVILLKDGHEALDFLYCQAAYADREKINPAVILLDIRMPRVDGLQVLRKIKSDPNLRSIPVVILSSSREESDLLESYHLGVNAFVVKPVVFSEFIEAVASLGTFWALLNEAPAIKV